MSTTTDPLSSSSAERAVKLSVVILLPAVFCLLAFRSIWQRPEPDAAVPSIATIAEPTAADAASVDAQPENRPVAAPFVPSANVAVHRAAATRETDVAARNAPLELSTAGRAVADPVAFAPEVLTHQVEQIMKAEVARAAREVDLYGDARRPENRFDQMRKEITDHRREMTTILQEVNNSTRILISKRRRARNDPSRQTALKEYQDYIESLRSRYHDQSDPTKPVYQPLKEWLVERDDLAGLPLAMGDECRLEHVDAEHLQTVSAHFRAFRRAPLFNEINTSRDDALLPAVQTINWTKDHIPGLVQVLSAEQAPLRLELVRILSEFRCRESSRALARLATFDLSSDVRQAAVNALDGRRPEEFRGELLRGLRYVWPPAADNAADALVSLDDRDAYTELARLASEDDPRAPYRTDANEWAVHELTRVNHMRNCLLCHAPAIQGNAMVTGTIPSPYDPPPVMYYEGAGYAARADVTYLRQDFSVTHRVDGPSPWPADQRFDYFVRERKLREEEAAKLKEQYSEEIYPQRASILYAMRKLSEFGPLEERQAAR